MFDGSFAPHPRFRPLVPRQRFQKRGRALLDILRERINANFRVDSASGCWLWLAGKNDRGYGRIFRRDLNRMDYVHRVMWEIHRGPIPPLTWVLHRCDVPACCNPAHLFLGSPKTNVHDMAMKGRHGTPPRGPELQKDQAHTPPHVTRPVGCPAEVVDLDLTPRFCLCCGVAVRRFDAVCGWCRDG